jgi:hypothetical protein
MQTVTTKEIRDAFVTQIQDAITPTFESLRDIRWNYVPSERKGGRALVPKKTRNFDIIFGTGVPNRLWNGGIGTAYEARVAIATSYAGIADAALVEDIKTQDNVDLIRALYKLVDPQLPGLTQIVAQGTQNESSDSAANVYVEHVFTVRWHQATA